VTIAGRLTESADKFRPETLVALEAVERALTIAGRGVGAEDVTDKDGRDVVTVADIAIEDAVRRTMAEASSFSVIGEERGGEAPADGSPYWLVDPICGTRNFASGIPLYCVNLALVERNEVTLAVVGEPSTGETHVAERGRGAWSLKEGARSMAPPFARDNPGVTLPRRRPHRGVRGRLGLGHSRWGRQPSRHRSGRHGLGYRRPPLVHRLGLARCQRQRSSP
jgi:fructose-1,6-bisphosphatase/inositol monophosphatase family enzyme